MAHILKKEVRPILLLTNYNNLTINSQKCHILNNDLRNVIILMALGRIIRLMGLGIF